MNEIDDPNRRIAPRLYVETPATIRENPRDRQPIPCLLQDISETGARLKVENGDMTPSAFELHIESEDFRVNCIVVWRSG